LAYSGLFHAAETKRIPIKRDERMKPRIRGIDMRKDAIPLQLLMNVCDHLG
jgi:hypothetical protein